MSVYDSVSNLLDVSERAGGVVVLIYPLSDWLYFFILASDCCIDINKKKEKGCFLN